MDQGLIPQRYARALYKVAGERNCRAQLYDIMCTLGTSFAAEPALTATVANPFVSPGEKTRLLMTAAGLTTTGTDATTGNITPHNTNGDQATQAQSTYTDFLRLLNRNKRMPYIMNIALAYQEIYRRDNHIARVTVTSAAPMTQEAAQRLRNIIQTQAPGYRLEYNLQVDPALIGGFTVAIDNSKLDASVSNELKQMRLKLLSH